MPIKIKVNFDPSFDGKFWTGNLNASAGVAYVGPLGLLAHLETCLGAMADWPASMVRVNDLALKLDTIPETARGFWEKSYSLDAIGVAAELLRWRDELMMAGWDGKSGQGRISQLAAATTQTLPGIPDRLGKILEFLGDPKTPKPDMDELFIIQPESDLPLLWRKVLDALEKKGVTSSPFEFTKVEANGNLTAVQSRPFTPIDGDESLLFLEPQTVWEAAEHVAAWLAQTLKRPTQTVIIGATPELDRALAAYGLPTSGAESRGPEAEEISNLLFLTLSLGQKIPDPARVLDFLLLDDQVLSRKLARELVKALHEYPGINNDKWNDAIQKGLEGIETKDAASIQKRLTDIFSGEIDDWENLSTEIIVQRLENILLPWLQKKLGPADGPSRFTVLHNSVKLLIDLVKTRGSEDIPSSQVKKMIADISDRAVRSLHQEQTGVYFVDAPEAMLAPADTVIWWNFTGDTVTPAKSLPLTLAEFKELESLGCDPRESWEQAAYAQSLRWKRPLELCGGQMIFVSPRQTLKGESTAPHPLRSELEANLAGNSLLPCRADGICSDLKTRVITPEPRQPIRTWNLPEKVTPREKPESPSGIEKMLECPFKWVMNYHAGLYEPLARGLREGGSLDGQIFHRIFHELSSSLSKDATVASKQAGDLFDEVGPALAASLFLPGAESDRQKFRKKLVESVERITAHIAATEGTVTGSEKKLTGSLGTLELEGYLDLILSSPAEIIDFKNSEGDKGKDLKMGVAIQLIAYAHLLYESKGVDAAVTYFILNGRKFLPDTAGISGISGWSNLEKSYLNHLDELKQRIIASGIPDDSEKPVKNNEKRDDGTIVLEPKCKYCLFDVLCGRNEMKEEK